MVEKRIPIPISAAIEKILQEIQPASAEMVPLSEAYGRILAEPIIAKHDVPPFDRSAYDGFAIHSSDSVGASDEHHVSFHVIDEVGAGYISKKTLAPGEAIRIMTGAMMPKDADAVVMLEQVIEKEDHISIYKSFGMNENVSPKGEDARKDERLIEEGAVITPGVIALLATFGYAHVKVAKKPVVGILSTGTELLEVEDDLVPGKIRNSNGPMIEAQLKRMGIENHTYGIQADNLKQSLQTVERAIKETDCLITTGGVSVGDFDFMPVIYSHLGANVLFNKVAIRPGSVTTVAVNNGKYLFGLSGNPSACYSGFELFVRPTLLKMMGSCKPFMPNVKAALAEDFLDANPFTRFIRATYEVTSSGLSATPAGFNKSNAVTSIARGNAFIVLPGGKKGWKAGDEVDLLLLGVEEGASRWML
ncbi:molybdopterin molybdotransferase MoeA [Pradoshia sp. D12]|uniref:molybdopterin molybdotransferase MoeA n=1 Tax=Bacillaceae TaxID=186817 RepID=UPI00112D203F|nr:MULTISPECIES: gephyrin-like molybdotransferase Glp [Bacillaceae]QFK71853.1 molybdopterin molybdotransferase MoeA [Pradoshia sp. D12]TPF73648.1 molybdopterin molybdotransferase MoeA [Bacillus sp. D12]